MSLFLTSVRAMSATRQLRRELRRKRRSIPPQQQRRHALQLAGVLGKHPTFLRAKRIAAYRSADGEIDPSQLLRLAHARKKQCHLPVLRAHPKRKLWFIRFREGDPLKTNRYGIPEPGRRGRHIRLPWALDLLLVPLVGFDADCNRLGMGGGYYDRTLAYLPQRRRWRRPTLIGIAHECQRVERIEAQPWDIPLDMVFTERALYRRPGARGG